MKQRALVTGATGFLGSALTQKLISEGTDVACVMREGKSVLTPSCTTITWNQNPEQLVSDIVTSQPDVIYHLATNFIAHHTTSDITPLIEANITLGMAVLEAAHAINATTIVTGSAWQHYKGAEYQPVSLYAATKQALWDIAMYYASEGLDVRELTFFDTYGPRDKRRKLIPLLLDAAATGEPLEMSSGTQLIDLLYRDDAVDALIQFAQQSRSKEVKTAYQHVARSGHPLTIREVVEKVESATGRSVNAHWGMRPDRPKEMLQNWEFGTPVPDWQPHVDLKSGLRACWDAR